MGQVSRGLGARAPRAWGPGPPGKNHQPLNFFANLLAGARRRGCRLKRLLRRGTWRETTGGYGCVLRPKKTWLAESGGIQATGACGPGLQGAWGPGPQGLGPGPPGAWGLFPTKTTNLSNYDYFFANLLVGAWRRRGCRLKRLLRRWGPGGKRSRDTPPTPAPLPPPRKGERKRVFTLSAFGNHPTRPPRSADNGVLGPKYHNINGIWALKNPII